MSEVAFHVCEFGDPADYRIVVGAQTYRFEWSDRFGALVIDRTGREGRQPPWGANFWKATSLWFRQGKQVDGGGYCVWRRPAPAKLRHIKGRQYLVIEIDPDDDIWPQSPEIAAGPHESSQPLS